MKSKPASIDGFLRPHLFCFNMCEIYTPDESNWHLSRRLLRKNRWLLSFLFLPFSLSFYIPDWYHHTYVWRILHGLTILQYISFSINNFQLENPRYTFFESLFEVTISCYSDKLIIQCVCNMKCVYFPMLFHLQYIYNVIKL